eukprot:g32430.t1
MILDIKAAFAQLYHHRALENTRVNAKESGMDKGGACRDGKIWNYTVPIDICGIDIEQKVNCGRHGGFGRHGGPVASTAASHHQGPGFDSTIRELSVWSFHILPVSAS